MNEEKEVLKKKLQKEIDTLFDEVGWKDSYDRTHDKVLEVVQICHRLHRKHNPAYRERCSREGIGEILSEDQLHLVAFPEEIWKGYSEVELKDGKKLGIFCEGNVKDLLEYINHYLVDPIKIDGLKESYLKMTNLKGGLDRLRDDIKKNDGTYLMTSSGTTGTSISLIPDDPISNKTRRRANRFTFDQFSDMPGYGPILPEKDFVVAYAPQDGSMLMVHGMKNYMAAFDEDRAYLTIPAKVYTRELRWRSGVFYGPTGKLLSFVLNPLLKVGGKKLAKEGRENTIKALKKAEKTGKRTMFFANQWMFLNALDDMEKELQRQRKQGLKKGGEPLVKLPPGSVMISGGGNKSGLDIDEITILKRISKVIGGIEKFVDGYGKAESLAGNIKCPEGNYHFDPHVIPFVHDGYIGWFDPRETNKVPAQLTGDKVDDLYYEPCGCGITTPYFKKIERDNLNRGSKGCAAALSEYA